MEALRWRRRSARAFTTAFPGREPYSAGEVDSPTLAFDYVLDLACAIFAIELGFIEARFTLLREAWDTCVLLSAVVLPTSHGKRRCRAWL